MGSKTTDDLGVRKVIRIPLADGYKRDTRLYCVEKRVDRARRAAVVPHLENVGAQRSGVPREQPLLFRSLRVADEQHPNGTEADSRDDARKVGIGEPGGPRGIRSEETHRYTVHNQTIAGVGAQPANPSVARRIQGRTIRLGASRKS